MEKLLIRPDEIGGLSRPIGRHVDTDKLAACIRESEKMDIKPVLGDTLYLSVRDNPESFETLLEGGEYVYGGNKYSFSGLKSALAYYAYSRVVRLSDGQVVRYGYVNKDSEYSSKADFKEKHQEYTDARLVADHYLGECLQYLKRNKPCACGGTGVRVGIKKFHVIGE